MQTKLCHEILMYIKSGEIHRSALGEDFSDTNKIQYILKVLLK